MKNKLYVAGLILAATFASCADESNELVSHNATVAVSAEMGGQTRTSLGDESKTVTWSEGDQIYLFDTDGTSNGVMTLSEGAGETFATFRGSVNGKFVSLDKALYPVPTMVGGEYTFEFPAEITWSENSAAPMIGDFSNNHVNFRNLAAMVRINLDGCSITDNSVLTLTMTGQAISGTATVDVDAETLSIGNGANNVNVSGLINAEFVDIPVPAGTYTGFSVTLDGTKIAEGTGSKELGKDDVVIVGKVSTDTEMTPEEDGSYLIESVADLYWFAEAVNNGNTFSGTTVKLAADINLANQQWMPIGNSTTSFQGTFDGQNHIISNLTINGEGKSNQGLFGMTTNGEIKNLTVNNAKVSGRLNVGVVAGTPYTSKYTNIKVTGHIEVNGMAYVGAVGGKNAYANWENITVNVDETSYVNANSVENGTAYRTYVGGVVGFNGEGGHSFKNITSNIDVKGSTCDVGGLFGIAHYNNQFENCVCTGDVEIYAATEAEEAEEVGGIAGVWHNENGTTVTFTNCSFTGEVITNFERGIVWYNNLVGKPYKSTGNGKLIVDGKSFTFANSMDNLNDALAGGNSNIALGGGTFTMPTTTGDVTISGTTETVITIDKPTAKNVTLNGVTIQGSGNYTGIQHSEKVVYENCVVKGTQFLYANEVLIKDCTVDLTEAADYIWTYGAKKVVFDNCVFNTKGKAILIYSEAADLVTNVTVKNCTFNATESAQASGATAAAIEIDSSLSTNGHYTLITEENTVDSDFSGEWRIKKSGTDNTTVNGVVYNAITIDGVAQ